MNNKIKDKGFSLMGEVRWIKRCSKTGKILEKSPWQKNQIVANDARGIYILLDLLAGNATYTGEITHGELGDDDTAATEADTDLGNGLERVQLASVSRSGKQVTFRFFFPDATTADDTYEEFGMFIDGNSGLGTGRIFNRIVLSSDIVKASGEDYTVACRLTATV